MSCRYKQFTSNYESRAIIYKRKMFVRLATGMFLVCRQVCMYVGRYIGRYVCRQVGTQVGMYVGKQVPSWSFPLSQSSLSGRTRISFFRSTPSQRIRFATSRKRINEVDRVKVGPKDVFPVTKTTTTNMTIFLKNRPPRPLFQLIFVLCKQFLQNKNVDFSKIRTRIVRVEGPRTLTT